MHPGMHRDIRVQALRHEAAFDFVSAQSAVGAALARALAPRLAPLGPWLGRALHMVNERLDLERGSSCGGEEQPGVDSYGRVAILRFATTATHRPTTRPTPSLCTLARPRHNQTSSQKTENPPATSMPTSPPAHAALIATTRSAM